MLEGEGMEIRFDTVYKQDLIAKFDALAGKPFLTDLTAYLKTHRVPKCWPVTIYWKKLKIKGWYFDDSMILIEKILKSNDTPSLVVTWGER